MTILVILAVIALLEMGRRGHRHIRRRRASLTVRENIPVGRNSWISFGHRFRPHWIAALLLLAVLAFLLVRSLGPVHGA